MRNKLLLAIMIFAIIGKLLAISNAQLAQGHNLRYDSIAHLDAANNIKLKFPDGEKDAASVLFNLKNGLKLNYGEISYLMGDFIGNPDSYVLDNKYKENFDLLYEKDQKEVKGRLVSDDIIQIKAVMKEIYERNIENIKNSRPLELTLDDEAKFNGATGGSSSKYRMVADPGVYLLLALNNFEHFGKEAVEAYKIIHKYALEIAAKGKGDINQLNYAYMLNAYASHYLVDIFSTGHIRVPRRELYDYCKFDGLGDYFAKTMHDLDGKNGLLIVGTNGKKWKGFGDDLLFIPENKVHKEYVFKALQLSANEIYDAYTTGNANITPSQEFVLPDVDKTKALEENPKALFISKDGTIYEWNDYQKAYKQFYCVP